MMFRKSVASSAVLLVAFVLISRTQSAAALEQEFPALSDDARPGTGIAVECDIPRAEGNARCGMFRVFEDREARIGRTVDIAFVVLEAFDPDRAPGEVIIPLPGGPGQTLTNAAPGFARATALREARDILLVDVRGVGRSRPLLDCPDFAIPVEARFGTVFPPEHIAMCHDILAERARLDLYTTNASVDDIEELRRWLGYEEVNLFGVSYGTRVAQVYMRRHPEAVRAVILNSVAPVFQLGYVHMARSLQTSLDLVVAACVAAPDCAREHPNLPERLRSVLQRLDEGPVEVEVDGARVAFGKGDLSYALRGLLYGRAEDVPGLIHRASEGDFQELAEYYLERTGWVGEAGGPAGYHFSALCAEDIVPLTDEDVAVATANTFMGDHLIAGYRAVCAAWDVAELPDSFWEPVRSDIPTLIISGERDPVTPPEWGEAVAEHLPNSLHVVVPGGGHGPGNDCTEKLEIQFLEEAGVESLDPSCIGS